VSKPLYQGQIDELRRLIRDLETRLKNEREQLGHREVFSIGRRGEVPAPLAADRGRVLGVDGWFTLTGSGGGLSTVYVDNVTIGGDGSATYPLSATLLSGTINSAIVSLSATIDSAIQAIGGATPDGSTLSSVTGVLNALPLSGTIDARFKSLSGSIDGHFNALSGTLNSAISAIISGSQAWTHTATGAEGTTMVASIPQPFPSADYHAFVTNYSGSASPVFKIDNKTTTTFSIISTAPFTSGDRVDILAISASFGPVADGTAIANLSGTINSAIVSLSATLNSAIQAGGGGTADVQYASDTFNRSDDASNMGTTDGSDAGDPATWVQDRGVWGITSNTAYCSTPAGGTAFNLAVVSALPTTAVSQYVQCTMSTITVSNVSGQGVVLCYIDLSNYYNARLNRSSGGAYTWVLQKVKAGSATTIVNDSCSPSANDVIRLEKINDAYLRMLVNGTEVARCPLGDDLRTDTSIAGILNVSNGGAANAARYENFSCGTIE